MTAVMLLRHGDGAGIRRCHRRANCFDRPGQLLRQTDRRGGDGACRGLDTVIIASRTEREA
jgi:hypothetical protein